MDILESNRLHSNHLVGGFCESHYILWCEKIQPSAKKSLFNAALEQLAQFIRHESVLFQAVDVSPDGLPEGQELEGKLLGGHVVLHGGFRKLLLQLFQAAGLCGQLAQAGYAGGDGCGICAAAQAKLHA